MASRWPGWFRSPRRSRQPGEPDRCSPPGPRFNWLRHFAPAVTVTSVVRSSRAGATCRTRCDVLSTITHGRGAVITASRQLDYPLAGIRAADRRGYPGQAVLICPAQVNAALAHGAWSAAPKRSLKDPLRTAGLPAAPRRSWVHWSWPGLVDHAADATLARSAERRRTGRACRCACRRTGTTGLRPRRRPGSRRTAAPRRRRVATAAVQTTADEISSPWTLGPMPRPAAGPARRPVR
jgi:hypothetical protein